MRLKIVSSIIAQHPLQRKCQLNGAASHPMFEFLPIYHSLDIFLLLGVVNCSLLLLCIGYMNNGTPKTSVDSGDAIGAPSMRAVDTRL